MAKITLNQTDLESAVKCQMEKMGLTSDDVTNIIFLPKRRVNGSSDSIECIIEYGANSTNNSIDDITPYDGTLDEHKSTPFSPNENE